MRTLPAVIRAGCVVSLSWVLLQAAGSAQAPTRPGVLAPQPQPATPRPPASPAASPNTSGTGRIVGRVLAADTGAPLRRAQISLSGIPGAARSTATDNEGRFAFEELPTGRFTVRASRSGYVTLSFGQRRPNDAPRPIQLGDGQTMEGVDFRLPPGGVIVATVLDDFGEPVSGMMIRAEEFRYVQGERQLAAAFASGGGAGATTNDRGEYRLFGLAAGEYYVSASPGPGASAGVDNDVLAFVQTYYPGTISSAEAQRVAVGAGQEVAVTISLAPIRTYKIAGIVRGADGGAPPPQIQASLRQDRAGGFTSHSLSMRADGRFEATGVAPGKYTLIVAPPISQSLSGGLTEYVAVPLTVSGDVTDLDISTRRGGTLRGRLVFDGGVPRDLAPGSISILAQSSQSMFGLPIGQPTWGDDWTFQITGAAGPRLIRLSAANQNWFLKSVSLNGRDVTDTPLEAASDGVIDGLEILVTRQRTNVNGSVTDARGASLSEYVVAVFAADSERWGAQSRHVAAARPDQNGQFEVIGLPPGEYLAVAVPALESGEERDPDVLARLAIRATAFTLGEGATRTLTLRVSDF